MCCQIITLIFGIIALVKGEFALTRNRVVSGAAARIIGGFLLLPLPLSFAAVFLLAMLMAVQGGGNLDEKRLEFIGNAISAGILVVCLLTAFGIAIFTAKPRKPKKLDDGPDDLPDDPEPGRPIPSEPDPRFRAR